MSSNKNLGKTYTDVKASQIKFKMLKHLVSLNFANSVNTLKREGNAELALFPEGCRASVESIHEAKGLLNLIP